jgi:threonine/homoserine/homoserine lactone efflux protein
MAVVAVVVMTIVLLEQQEVMVALAVAGALELAFLGGQVTRHLQTHLRVTTEEHHKQAILVVLLLAVVEVVHLLLVQIHLVMV